MMKFRSFVFVLMLLLAVVVTPAFAQDGSLAGAAVSSGVDAIDLVLLAMGGIVLTLLWGVIVWVSVSNRERDKRETLIAQYTQWIQQVTSNPSFIGAGERVVGRLHSAYKGAIGGGANEMLKLATLTGWQGDDYIFGAIAEMADDVPFEAKLNRARDQARERHEKTLSAIDALEKEFVTVNQTGG